MQHSADARGKRGGRGKEELVGALASAKSLARLGDAIVNFVASASLTLYYRRPIGVRVKDEILRRAWRGSSLAVIARGTTGSRGEDLAEGVIAYAWLNGLVSTDDMIRELLRSLEERGDEEGGLVLGLRRILDLVAD